MRLIDGDALKSIIVRRRKEAKTLTGIDMVMLIDDAKTVDAVPVVHGRWIEYPECLQYPNAHSDSHIVCSNCEECFSILENCTERFDYCPHCGAKMDLEAQDAKEKG